MSSLARRIPWRWLFVVALAFCVAWAPVGLLAYLISRPGNYELVEAADGHFVAGRHAQALEAYEEVFERDPSYGDPPYYACLGVAECREKLGDTTGALEAVDTALAGGQSWHAHQIKARLIERQKGLEAAVAYFEALIKKNPADWSLPHMLGEFHMEAGRYEGAASAFKRAIRIVTKTHGFSFDADGWLIETEATLKKENNDFADLWPTLEYLADVLLRLSRDEEAMLYATMGVSIGQQLKRLAGYYSPKELAAGDADCRITRAFVLMRRGELGQAQTEIKHAKAIADGNAYLGWKRSVERAQAELDRLRAASAGD